MVIRNSSEGRWRVSKCARCDKEHSFMTRGVPKKYCDACRDAIALEKRRELDRSRGPRPRSATIKIKLIPYAGWDGGGPAW